MTMEAPWRARMIETSWRTRTNVQNWLILICGVTLMVIPWGLGFSFDIGASVCAWTGGFVMLVMAISMLVWYAEWEDWGALIAGVLMIILPWELGFDIHSEIWAFTAIGSIVVATSIAEIWLIRRRVIPS